MSSNAPRLAVIGAGPMGLAAAFYGLRYGFDVTLFEASAQVGGMAAHFDFDGLSIERFYHFCCTSDSHTLELLEELGMGHAMKWVSTTMGYYVHGKVHPWGDPIALLKFPHMNLVQKLRYGLQAFSSTKRSDWRKLDGISAKDWFIWWCGRDVYDLLWRPLLELKFHEHSDEVSAAWMWQRIKRLGNSRKSLFEDRLGYIDGGSEALMLALANRVKDRGGSIRTNAPVTAIAMDECRVRGVDLASGEHHQADFVISTAPMPVVSRMLRDAPGDLRAPYQRIKNIGVVCVMLKLSRPVSRHFWVNISDPDLDIPGIVEFSNLRPLPQPVVYVPFYMPTSNARFSLDDDYFIGESMRAISSINPTMRPTDVLATHVGRLTHAQPVCEVGFAALLPPVQTRIEGLQIADTCFYYPEDRGVSESIGFARKMVETALQQWQKYDQTTPDASTLSGGDGCSGGQSEAGSKR